MPQDDFKFLMQCANAGSLPLLMVQLSLVPAYVVGSLNRGGADGPLDPYIDLIGLLLVVCVLAAISGRSLLRKRRIQKLFTSPERIASLRVVNDSVEIRDDRGHRFKLRTVFPFQAGPGPAKVLDALRRLAPQAQLLT